MAAAHSQGRRRARRAAVGLFAAFYGLAVAVPPNLAAASPAQEAPAPDAAQTSAITAIEQATGGTAEVVVDPTTGAATFVGTATNTPIPTPGAGPAAQARADAFVASKGAAFGLGNDDLDPIDVTKQSVHYQQVHEGIPVLAGELIVRLGASEGVVAAAGELAPKLDVTTTPSIDAPAATRTARALAAKHHDGDQGEVVDPAELWIYDPVLLGTPGDGPARLVWRLSVASESPVPFDDLVLIDAVTGGVVLHIQELNEAMDRFVCDKANVVSASDACVSGYARVEGQGATGNVDVDLAYEYSGDTYDYFFNNFGRDSLDNAGMALRSTVRYCPSASECPYQNAYWNGTQMVYGAGFAAADDVVGHELSHGVTDFESHLFYYYQSGAINESLSDVFGELIDLSNGSGTDTAATRWLMGEDLPSIGAIRDMENPPTFGDPDRMQSPQYVTATSDSGGVHSNSGVNNKAAFLMVDGGTFNGRTVAALGADKTGRIYYEAATNLLTSGSDYLDLYHALRQGCTNLVGTAGITAGDCDAVTQAVEATEMHLPAPAPVSAAEAPVCPANTVVTNLFYDDLENTASGAWTRTVISGSQAWAYPQNPNIFSGFDATYSTSGTKNMFGGNRSTSSNTAIAMTANVVPPVGKTTYLRFNHAFDLEATYDGGRVEYSTNNGGAWTDATALFTHNGYNSTATSMGGAAFSGRSGGYYSSRLNLTSLAGQNVRIRFRLASDSSVNVLGWYVDDVRFYFCNTAPVANAGPDQSVAKNTAFTLDASGSSDPDGDTLTYAWLQIAGTPAVITDPNAASTQVTGINADSRLTFQVTVTDASGLTHTDTVQVTVGNPK